jgi:hypothetical protein
MRGLRRGFGLLAGASILLLLVPAMARAAGPGDLDGTFSNDGMQTVDVGTGDHSEQILVSGGKILVLGEGSSDLTLVRLTRAGDPDPTFGGGDGIVKMNLLGVEEPFGGLALLPGGRIMAAVSTSNGGYDRLGLARFTPAGAPTRPSGEATARGPSTSGRTSSRSTWRSCPTGSSWSAARSTTPPTARSS